MRCEHAPIRRNPHDPIAPTLRALAAFAYWPSPCRRPAALRHRAWSTRRPTSPMRERCGEPYPPSRAMPSPCAAPTGLRGARRDGLRRVVQLRPVRRLLVRLLFPTAAGARGETLGYGVNAIGGDCNLDAWTQHAGRQVVAPAVSQRRLAARQIVRRDSRSSRRYHLTCRRRCGCMTSAPPTACCACCASTAVIWRAWTASVALSAPAVLAAGQARHAVRATLLDHQRTGVDVAPRSARGRGLARLGAAGRSALR